MIRMEVKQSTFIQLLQIQIVRFIFNDWSSYVFRGQFFGLFSSVKVHLTPNFFFAQINLHIMLSKSPQKFLDAS